MGPSCSTKQCPCLLLFSQCQGKGKLLTSFQGPVPVLSASISLGVAAWHLVTFPKFLTPSSPSHMTRCGRSCRCSNEGSCPNIPAVPHPRQVLFSNLRIEVALKLHGGPPRWKDIAGRSDEVFESPATHHIRHSEASEREADSVGWGGHRQHEGQGGRQSAGEHDIERVEADALGLEREKVGRDEGSPHPRGEGVAPILLLPLSEG